MAVFRLVVSGKKFFRDFHRFLEIKVIDVFSVCVRLRNVNLNVLPTSRALRLSPESISLTPDVFSALYWQKKLKTISMLMFSIWGLTVNRRSRLVINNNKNHAI
jgi:hypothetical protein